MKQRTLVNIWIPGSSGHKVKHDASERQITKALLKSYIRDISPEIA